jgi:hypothetical protein
VVASILVFLALAQAAADPKPPVRWLNVFTPLPGARQLCSGNALGQSGGRRTEILFTLYATTRDPAEAALFYAKAHGVPSEPDGRRITVRASEGSRVLSVHPVLDSYPQCGVKPAADDRAVIVVSEMLKS